MPNNTAILGLYKKAPIADALDKFSITLMLNNNWDRLDAQYLVINAKYPPNGYAAAIGDGNTDDSAAIQALVNYASSLGFGTIYFPKGTYKIVTTINLALNISLLGVGIAGTIFINSTGAACFQYLGIVECPVLDTVYSRFAIKGGSKVNEVGIRMRNAAGYKIVGVSVESQLVGMQLSYGNHIAVQDCQISYCTRGLLLSNLADGVNTSPPYLDGLTVTNCGFNENAYHIEHRGSSSTGTATITGNHFYGYTTIVGIWLAATKGIHIAGNWWEMGAGGKAIVSNYISSEGVVLGTPFGTAIIGNCIAAHGTIFIDIIEGSGTVIEGNTFTGPSVGAVHIGTGGYRNFVGCNNYENMGTAYKVLADYKGLLDTSDRTLMAGRILQQKSGTVALTADGTNGFVEIVFDAAPADWNKVSCNVTWKTATLSAYTDGPSQISWTQADSVTIRIKAAGKTAGSMSYVISESN